MTWMSYVLSVFPERINHSRGQPQIVLRIPKRGGAQVIRLNHAQPEFWAETEIHFASSRPSAVAIRGFEKRTTGFGETGLGTAKKTVSGNPEAPPLDKILRPDHEIVLCEICCVMSAGFHSGA